MANPHPTPRLENLRQPWQPGTSGNPAGYSQGRRISDAIEGLIDELGLQREFATAAIAMALGQKHLLKQKVTDPETGKDVWVEQKPDLAWFQMIEQRLEPAAQQRDADARLRAILDDIEREDPDPVDQGKAAQSPERSQSASAGKPFHVVGPSGAWVPAGKEKAESTGTLFQDVPAQAGSGHNSLAIRRSPLATFHDVPAHAGSGQVALQAAQADLAAADPGTTLAVERPSGQRSVPIPERSSRAVQSWPGMLPGSRRSLTLSLRDCSRERSAALLPGSSGSGPDWQAGSVGRWRRSPSWLASCSFTRPSSSMTSVPVATSFRRARSRLTSNLVPR